jgi:membrane-bound ClpP family serine protease
MLRSQWSFKILIRYTLLQLPAIALVIGLLIFIRRWVDIPSWLHWGIIIVWVAKDIILFPFVWRAYDWNQKESGHAMLGMHGVALEPLDPLGYILVRGERWRAQPKEKGIRIEKGQRVEVLRIKDLTLYVQPVDQTMREW